MEKEALAVYDEDIEANKAIGKNGSRFFSDGDVVMTHYNAGALATGGYGTALGVVRRAVEEGKNVQVFACETQALEGPGSAVGIVPGREYRSPSSPIPCPVIS